MTLAYAVSALSFVLGIPLLVLLIWLALQPIMRHFERSEWRELTLVSTSPEGCRVCGVAGMHAMDCARSGLDGAA